MIVKITKLLPNLEGLFFLNQKTYSIPYVVPEEEVFISFKKIKRKKIPYIEGIYKKNENFRFSENPLCKYFSFCGGCKGQHLNYEYQWNLKIEVIKNNYLELFPKAKFLEIPSQKVFHYRNRMDFVVDKDIVGLRKAKFFDQIIDIEECKIQSEIANQILKIFRKLIKNFPIGFDRKQNNGIIKYITIRIGNFAGIILTIIRENKNELYDQFIKEFIFKLKEDNIHFSLYECYTSNESEISNIEENLLLYGKEKLEFSFGDLILDIPPEGFFQPNPEIIEKMFFYGTEFFLNQIELKNLNFHLIDLYCGIGVLSLYFYKFLNLHININKIIGFEITEKSVEFAKKNFEKYKNYFKKNIEYNFYKFDLSKKFDLLLNENNILILDPPRSGLSVNLLKWIKNQSPFIDWIFYLSCNPAKQFEEIKILKEYFIPKMIIFGDPFPHTEHWESLMILQKKNF